MCPVKQVSSVFVSLWLRYNLMDGLPQLVESLIYEGRLDRGPKRILTCQSQSKTKRTQVL